MGAPDFSFDVTALGGSPLLVPGVEAAVSSFVKHTVLRPFTYPEGFVYDFAQRSAAAAFEKPEVRGWSGVAMQAAP